jgi:hypothetical protein
LPPRAGPAVLRGITSLRVKLNFLANEIRLSLYLSEADAQAIATSLRKNQPETAHLLAMMALEQGLDNVFSYGQYGYLKVVHPQVVPGKRSGLALGLVPPVVVNALKAAIKRWAGLPLIEYLRQQGPQLVQAAEDYADGRHPAGRHRPAGRFPGAAPAADRHQHLLTRGPVQQSPGRAAFQRPPGPAQCLRR